MQLSRLANDQSGYEFWHAEAHKVKSCLDKLYALFNDNPLIAG